MPVLSLIFGLFAIVNAAVSQFYPSLYFISLQNEREAAVPYLKSIQSLPQFNTQLALFSDQYGESIKEGVYYNDSIRDKYITELEQYLHENPSARDINYQLSILYRQKGDKEKSREYLEKARAVDPAL